MNKNLIPILALKKNSTSPKIVLTPPPGSIKRLLLKQYLEDMDGLCLDCPVVVYLKQQGNIL